MQKYRSYVLPIAIVLGLLFHGFFARLDTIWPWLLPLLISLMLFLTYCHVDIKDIHLQKMHGWLLLFQVFVSLTVYLIVHQFDEILAQGLLVTILTPTATAAVVVAVMLGANLNTMATYNIFCNLVIAIVAPIYFSFIGVHQDMPFLQSCFLIMRKVAPLLILPLIMALLMQFFLPRLNKIIKPYTGNTTFYLWALSLIIVVGRTIDYINIHIQDHGFAIIIAMIIGATLLCVLQFGVGRIIGRKYNDVVAGGQSLGQKNTVLAIWMAQTYLNPLCSVLPAVYVVLQNVFNSYQMFKKDRKQ